MQVAAASRVTDLLTKSTVRIPGIHLSIASSDVVVEMGSFLHDCEGEMVCESINTKIPYFNAPIYLENKVRHTRSRILELQEAK